MNYVMKWFFLFFFFVFFFFYIFFTFKSHIRYNRHICVLEDSEKEKRKSTKMRGGKKKRKKLMIHKKKKEKILISERSSSSTSLIFCLPKIANSSVTIGVSFQSRIYYFFFCILLFVFKDLLSINYIPKENFISSLKEEKVVFEKDATTKWPYRLFAIDLHEGIDSTEYSYMFTD